MHSTSRRAAAALVAAAVVLTGCSPEAPESERAPAPPSVPAAQVAPSHEPVAGADDVATFERRCREDSRDWISRRILADLLMRKGRETGDPAFYPRAETAAREAVKLAPADAACRLTLAEALLGQHRFVEALELCRGVLARDPANLGAVALAADAAMESGRYDDARAFIERLRAEPPLPVILARLAQWEELHGRPDEALVLARKARKLARDVEPERQAWYAWRVADLCFHTAKLEEAERGYSEALALDPNHRPALHGLAEVRSAQGRADEAIELLRRAAAGRADPTALLALSEALAEAGHAAEASEVARSADELGSAHPELYGHALSVHLADEGRDLERALRLADATLVDRDDVDGHDARAWVLHKLGRNDDAAKEIALALRTGKKEPSFLKHAAAICRARGDEAGAKAYLDALAPLGAWHAR